MIKIVATTLIVVFVVFCFCYLAPMLSAPSSQATLYRGVVDFWHIETFEGGSSSRKGWLNSVARQFEKANKGMYVCISTYTHQQAIDKLKAGETFDLISFSVGTGNAILPYLQPLDVATQSILDVFLDAGKVSNTQYALAYSTGFYALFARQKHLDSLGVTDLALNVTNCSIEVKIGKNSIKLDSLGCGFGSFNNPLLALGGTASVAHNLTQYQAYEQFVGGKSFVVLLGTQRDVYRLSNKVGQGKIDSLAFCALDGYTDLVQYLGISNTAGQKSDACRKLVEYVTSTQAQLSLCDVYLLSPTDLPVYSDGWMKQAQDCLPKLSAPNVFVDTALLTNGDKYGD